MKYSKNLESIDCSKNIEAYELFNSALYSIAGMTFEEVCNKCIEEKGFIKEWSRLHKLDDIGDYEKYRETMPEFFDFVRDCICMPLIRQYAEKVK